MRPITLLVTLLLHTVCAVDEEADTLPSLAQILQANNAQIASKLDLIASELEQSRTSNLCSQSQEELKTVYEELGWIKAKLQLQNGHNQEELDQLQLQMETYKTSQLQTRVELAQDIQELSKELGALKEQLESPPQSGVLELRRGLEEAQLENSVLKAELQAQLRQTEEFKADLELVNASYVQEIQDLRGKFETLVNATKDKSEEAFQLKSDLRTCVANLTVVQAAVSSTGIDQCLSGEMSKEGDILKKRHLSTTTKQHNSRALRPAKLITTPTTTESAPAWLACSFSSSLCPAVREAFESPEESCPPGWTEYPWSSMCVKGFSKIKDFNEASRFCKAQGQRGNLVSIHNQQQQDWLVAEIIPQIGVDTWIGFTDTQVEGHFQWTDGSGVDAQLWHTGQPNNLGGSENCAYLWKRRDYFWADRACEDMIPFICERGLEVDPDLNLRTIMSKLLQ